MADADEGGRRGRGGVDGVDSGSRAKLWPRRWLSHGGIGRDGSAPGAGEARLSDGEGVCDDRGVGFGFGGTFGGRSGGVEGPDEVADSVDKARAMPLALGRTADGFGGASGMFGTGGDGGPATSGKAGARSGKAPASSE